MVDKITYSQLAKIAQEQGKNVAEVAAENGISESELADMKLQEAKLGGEMEAPVDVATFSHKAVDINGTKGLVSFYDPSVQDGTITLSDAAKKELGKYGVNGLVAHEGELYAQHNDGNEYPLGNVKDYDLEWANRQRTWMDVAKAFFGAGMMPLALAGALASCNDIDMAQEGTQIDKLERLSPYLVTIINELGGLRGDIKVMREDMNSGFQELSNNDKQIITRLDDILASLDDFKNKSEIAFSEVKALIKNVENWLKLIEGNQETQIKLQIQGNKTFAEFAAELFAILEQYQGNYEAALKAIIEKMQEIEDVNIDTNNTVKEISEKIDKLKVQFDDSRILEAIDKLAEKSDKANALLELILDAITMLGDDMKNYFGRLIVEVSNNGDRIDDLSALLKAIKKSVDDGNAQAKADAKAILEAIESLGFKVVDGMGKIFEAVEKGNVKLDEILVVLKNIQALIEKFSTKAEKLGNAILDAIGKINFSVTVDLSGIEKLLKDIGKKQDATTVTIEKLTEVFTKFSGTTTEQLNTIIGLIGDNAAKLNTIIDLLVTMSGKGDDLAALIKAINDNVVANGKKAHEDALAIMDAINKLGADVAYGFAAILEAFNKQPDYTSRLDAILDKLDGLGKTAEEILKAIKDHDVKITVDVTGKVTCECNCNCGGNHEGIIGKLEDILN